MRRLVILVAVVAVAFTGCRGDDPGPPPAEWSGEVQTIADGSNRFAVDLYKELAKENGNVFFSPYSVHAALAMTATGAKGETREQMARVLHLPADPAQHLAAGDLGRYYAHPRKDYDLSTANAIWGQTGCPWRPDWLAALSDRFGAAFHEANFAADPDAERRRINSWAGEQTRGKIPELLEGGRVTPSHRMVLVNAVYFKGAWQDRFDPRRTIPLPFTRADGSKVDAPMMRREGGFRRYVERGPDGPMRPAFQMAELPYRGGELSMVVLLPGKHDGLPYLEAKLTPETLAGWLAQARDTDKADLILPKFRIETPAHDLIPPLQRLGIADLFDEARADLTGMHAAPERLYVNFVVQKAFVDVNEEGTEAAAATAVGARKVSAPLDFRADRPFLFLIRDVKRGTILFLGRVANPTG